MAKAAEFDAIVVALAAMARLGLEEHVAEVLEPDVMLPQVAQGALAVECRAGDEATVARLAEIDDPAARTAVEAERAFLRQLGSGCELACGALAEVLPGGGVAIDVLLASIDGRTVLRAHGEGPDAVAVGTDAARRLLDDLGGRDLLDHAARPGRER